MISASVDPDTVSMTVTARDVSADNWSLLISQSIAKNLDTLIGELEVIAAPRTPCSYESSPVRP